MRNLTVSTNRENFPIEAMEEDSAEVKNCFVLPLRYNRTIPSAPISEDLLPIQCHRNMIVSK